MLRLVDEEQVWLMVNDEDGTFWLYEGRRAAIQVVLNECYHLDEIYVISKSTSGYSVSTITMWWLA